MLAGVAAGPAFADCDTQAISVDDCQIVVGPGHAMLPSITEVSDVVGVVLATPGVSTQTLPWDLTYHSGAVQKVQRIYVSFWGWPSTLSAAESSYKSTLTSFLADVASSTYLGVDIQYTDGGGNITGGSYGGAWSGDSVPVPAEPTDQQVGLAAERAAIHFGRGADRAFVIALPPHHDPADFGVRNGYCAKHNYVAKATVANTAFVLLPYLPDARLGCSNGWPSDEALTIVLGHEIAEVQTDPYLDGWWDSDGQENADKCDWADPQNTPPAAERRTIGSGTYRVQPLWSNKSSNCVFTAAAGDATVSVKAGYGGASSSAVVTTCQVNHATPGLVNGILHPGAGRMVGRIYDPSVNAPNLPPAGTLPSLSSGPVHVPTYAALQCSLDNGSVWDSVGNANYGYETDADSGYRLNLAPAGGNTLCADGHILYDVNGSTVYTHRCITF